MPTPTLEEVLGTTATIITGANLNALASGSLVLGAAFSNVIGDSAGGGFPLATLKLHLSSMTVSAGGVVDGWFLTAADGSTYEQGGTSVTPQRAPDFSIQIVPQTAVVDVELRNVMMPICATVKCLLRNNALGAATPSDTAGYLKVFYQSDSYPSV